MAVAPTEKSFVHADISRDLYFYGVANEWTTIKAEDFEKVRFYWRVAAGSVTLRNFIARSDKGEAGLFPNIFVVVALLSWDIKESCVDMSYEERVFLSSLSRAEEKSKRPSS